MDITNKSIKFCKIILVIAHYILIALIVVMNEENSLSHWKDNKFKSFPHEDY